MQIHRTSGKHRAVGLAAIFGISALTLVPISLAQESGDRNESKTQEGSDQVDRNQTSRDRASRRGGGSRTSADGYDSSGRLDRYQNRASSSSDSSSSANGSSSSYSADGRVEAFSSSSADANEISGRGSAFGSSDVSSSPRATSGRGSRYLADPTQTRSYSRNSRSQDLTATSGTADRLGASSGIAGDAVSITRSQSSDENDITTRVTVHEKDREITIFENDRDGIEITVRSTKRGAWRDATHIEADSAKDLAQKHPESFQLYRKYMLENGDHVRSRTDPNVDVRNVAPRSLEPRNVEPRNRDVRAIQNLRRTQTQPVDADSRLREQLLQMLERDDVDDSSKTLIEQMLKQNPR